MTERGEVWWGQAPFKGEGIYRPWLVVSTPSHPFAGEECIALALTTTDHEEGLGISKGAWVSEPPEVNSFVSPWYVATLKLRELDRQQGRLDDGFVSQAVRRFHDYVPIRQSR